MICNQKRTLRMWPPLRQKWDAIKRELAGHDFMTLWRSSEEALWVRWVKISKRWLTPLGSHVSCCFLHSHEDRGRGILRGLLVRVRRPGRTRGAEGGRRPEDRLRAKKSRALLRKWQEVQEKLQNKCQVLHRWAIILAIQLCQDLESIEQLDGLFRVWHVWRANKGPESHYFMTRFYNWIAMLFFSNNFSTFLQGFGEEKWLSPRKPKGN